MQTQYTVPELKEIYKHAYYSHFLSTDHEADLFQLITEESPHDILELALEILTIDPKNCLKIIAQFELYPKPTQIICGLILSSYQDAILQNKLFDLIKKIDDEDVLITFIFCMAKSPYLNIASILDHLNTEDPVFKDRIIQLLELTPLDKFELFIAATPELPHEALFRRIYGNDMIDALRGRSTNPSK